MGDIVVLDYCNGSKCIIAKNEIEHLEKAYEGNDSVMLVYDIFDEVEVVTIKDYLDSDITRLRVEKDLINYLNQLINEYKEQLQ